MIPNISIVLNIHNEGQFLRRTIASLKDAIFFAQCKGLTFEIILVLDRPDEFTCSVIRDLDLSFISHRIETVDNGSLGLSRNAGIALATGEYVALADADDLLSFNYFSACNDIVTATPDAGVFPEYLYAFGARCHVAQYRDAKTFSARAFFDLHPFTSRLFIRRALLLDTPFVETPRSSLYAYEDWHLNATLVAKGIQLRIAPDAWLFYRQRPNSIMATTGADRLIPYTSYFDPAIYRCIANRQIEPLQNQKMEKQQLLRSMVVTEMLHAANVIEPAIDIEHIRAAGLWFPPVDRTPSGDAYLEVCEALSHSIYDHVALVPFVSDGGGEKFLFNVLSELQQQIGETRVLVLGGEAYKSHSMSQLAKVGCDFLDLYEIAQRHGANVHQLALRVIQATAVKAQLHLLPCPFAMTYFSLYGKSSDDQIVNLYVFSIPTFFHEGRSFSYGDNFSFVSNFGKNIDRIISDNWTALNKIRRTIDLPKTTYHVLYSYVEPRLELVPSALKDGHIGLRILWASRLDYEKRPELLRSIAKELAAEELPVHFDVYGSSVFGGYDSSLFDGLSNVSYQGAFSDFMALPLGKYDLFLYTSFFDGIPNVLLEAMSAGLPVMAPDVGGISELIENRKTGILISQSFDDATLMKSYVAIIREMCCEKRGLDHLAQGAMELILNRHSAREYASTVRRIYKNGH